QNDQIVHCGREWSKAITPVACQTLPLLVCRDFRDIAISSNTQRRIGNETGWNKRWHAFFNYARSQNRCGGLETAAPCLNEFGLACGDYIEPQVGCLPEPHLFTLDW